MLPTRKRKSTTHEQRQTQTAIAAEELEALRLQINQIQAQVNTISRALAQLNTRSFRGLYTMGVILYFLFLPLYWVKWALTLLYHLILLTSRWAGLAWALLTGPQSYWKAFYWLSFAWILMLDGGLKIVYYSIRNPRQLAKSIGLVRQ